MTTDHMTPIAGKLFDWFAGHRRELPWRQARGHGAPRDPYRVWVAEMMLQQTQVSVVIPYYRAFLERFPTLRSLAESSQDDVLRVWQGMGYYARARHLHRAARRIQAEFNGHIPGDRAALLSLPGIGDYTAGAILSLAFAQDVPALDANARRVLARLYSIDDQLDSPAASRRLRDAAEANLPRGNAGAFNEALMDLGALVCTASAPDCGHCPLRTECRALAQGRVAGIPARRPSRPVPHFDVTAAVIWRQGRLLLTQRPNEGMLGGLWEFPGGKCEGDESLSACLEREIREELGLEIAVGSPVISVDHAYSHMRITLHAFHCRPLRGVPRAIGVQDFRWVDIQQMADFPLSVADQRVAAAILREKPT